MTGEEVLEEVASYPCKHIVVTGGEPLLHQRILSPLLTRLKSLGYFIEVETNGTLAPSPEISNQVDCLNVSPKISNSMMPEELRIRPASLEAFARTGKAWFKFVVQAETDVVEIEDLIATINLPRERILLMPEGTDIDTLSSRSRWLVELCKSHNFRYCPRLHILLYGNKRGT